MRSIALLASVTALLVLPAVAQGHQFKRCVSEKAPAPFTVYHLGESFEGDALEERLYECRPPRPPPETGRTNYVAFLYGDGGRVQVHTSPACDIWWGLYNLAPPDQPIRRPKLTRVRGVPAAYHDRGTLDLYTGDVTVMIFANTRAKARRAAKALREAGSEEAGGDLPPPLPGALRGRMDCGFKFSFLDVRQGDLLAFNISRPAYLDVELERREGGEWVWSDQRIFAAARGTTFRELGVRPGRYRGTVTAWDHRGRRTHVRTIRFRVRPEE
jgi:hypothetical protein